MDEDGAFSAERGVGGSRRSPGTFGTEEETGDRTGDEGTGEAAGGGDAQSKSNIILLRRKVVFYSFVHSISTELAIKCQQQHFL